MFLQLVSVLAIALQILFSDWLKSSKLPFKEISLLSKNKYGGRQEYGRSKLANLEPSSLHESQNDAKKPKIQLIAIAFV